MRRNARGRANANAHSILNGLFCDVVVFARSVGRSELSNVSLSPSLPLSLSVPRGPSLTLTMVVCLPSDTRAGGRGAGAGREDVVRPCPPNCPSRVSLVRRENGDGTRWDGIGFCLGLNSIESQHTFQQDFQQSF